MMQPIVTTFEVRKTKKQTHGRVEVRRPGGDTPHHYGVYYYVGPNHAGYVAVKAAYGENLAVGLAAKLVKSFALQQGCKYVCRDGGSLRKV